MDSTQRGASPAVRSGAAEAEPLAAAASAVVAMVAGFLDGASDIPSDAASFRDRLRTLPPWSESPPAWARALHEVLEPYRLPAPAELEARSTALHLALSAASWARSVVGCEPLAAARNLTLAGTKAGALAALVLGLRSDGAEQMARSAFAKLGGGARWASDPKSAEKAEIRRRWQAWQDGRERYTSGAEFALAMVNEFVAIKSTQVVERWATQWRREREAARRAPGV